MIAIPRRLARAFRAAARKCVSGRPRGPAPPVVVAVRGGRLTLTTRPDEVTLSVADPDPVPTEDRLVVVPMAALDPADGPGGGPLELDVSPKLEGEVRWSDRGVPRSAPFDAILPGRQHEPSPQPDEWSPVPAGFLAALHECGRTASRERSARFALHRVQVRGGAGQVVGTDGKVALICSGFRLPFADDLVVPAVPVFGSKELAAEADVRVGLAGGALVVGAGPWAVWLPADRAAKYPEVAAVVPTPPGRSVAGVDDCDAGELLGLLPGLPGADDGDGPVTLDVGGGVRVRAAGGGEVAEVRLTRSTSAGPPARAAVPRAVLRRALALGCRTLRLAGDGKPLVAEGGGRTLIAVTLDPTAAVSSTPDARVARTDPAAPGPKSIPTSRRTTMRPHETNGHAGNGRPDPPAGEPPDPLAEAEALRAALAEASARAGRLVAALKLHRREKRKLESAWQSLRQLHLGS